MSTMLKSLVVVFFALCVFNAVSASTLQDELCEYRVKEGDSLLSIATYFNMPWKQLVVLNKIRTIAAFVPKSILKIPAIYCKAGMAVRSGDSNDALSESTLKFRHAALRTDQIVPMELPIIEPAREPVAILPPEPEPQPIPETIPVIEPMEEEEDVLPQEEEPVPILSFPVIEPMSDSETFADQVQLIEPAVYVTEEESDAALQAVMHLPNVEPVSALADEAAFQEGSVSLPNLEPVQVMEDSEVAVELPTLEPFAVQADADLDDSPLVLPPEPEPVPVTHRQVPEPVAEPEQVAVTLPQRRAPIVNAFKRKF